MLSKNDNDLIISLQHTHKAQTKLTKGFHPFESTDRLPGRTSLNVLFTLIVASTMSFLSYKMADRLFGK